jgi:hypothetical protein
MRRAVKTSLLCCLLCTCLACTRRGVGANNAGAGSACAFLSGAEIKSVQGEDVAEMQGSERTAGSLLMSQCYYRLPTFNKSVNLEIIRPATGNASANAVKQYWEERFHRTTKSESEEEREREQEERERGEKKGGETKGERQADEREREEKESEASRPQPVPGVGDEAFWMGNQITASLYVLKKDVIVRLSIGGAEDQPAKIKKATTLAQQALKRL